MACPTIKGLVLKQPSRVSDDISFSVYTKIISACAGSLERLIVVGDTQAFPLSQGLFTCIRLGFKSAESIALKELEVHYVNYLDTYGEPMAADRIEAIKLIPLLKVIPDINTLRMTNISFSTENLDKIFEVIAPGNFKELSFVNCNIDKNVGKHLANKKLIEASNLEVLNLSHNKLEHAAGQVLRRLAGKEHFRVLDMSYNFLTHAQDTAKFFEGFIQKTPSLEYLNFAFTNLHNKISETDIAGHKSH